MGELTTDEYALIKAYFPRHGFNGGHDLSDIRIHLARSQSSVPVDRVLQALIAKRVLDASPDGRLVKFTDYGFELVGAMTNAQDEWDKQKIIRISILSAVRFRFGRVRRSRRTASCVKSSRRFGTRSRSWTSMSGPWYSICSKTPDFVGSAVAC